MNATTILVKAYTSEYYDAVSHAVISLTPELLHEIAARYKIIKSISEQGGDATAFAYCIEFWDSTPDFIDLLSAFGQDSWWSELDLGPTIYMVFPADVPMPKFVRGIELCRLRMHTDGDFYWEANDKHVGDMGRISTPLFTLQTLREWAKMLGIELDI